MEKNLNILQRIKFLDIEGRKTSIIAPPVDHDHITGFIRGILSEKLNLLWINGKSSLMEIYLNQRID